MFADSVRVTNVRIIIIIIYYTPFRQFDPVISCVSFGILKISFWCSVSLKLLTTVEPN